MEQVQSADPNKSWGALSLVFTDHAAMARIHGDYLGDPRSTDVMSFAYPPMPPSTEWTGEVLVNVEQAVETGPDFDGPERELALYIAHGCQHLTGAEDDTRARKARMRRVETAWLQQAERNGVLQLLTIQTTR